MQYPRKFFQSILFSHVLTFCFLLVSLPSIGQTGLLPGDTAKAGQTEPAWPEDSLGRRSPRGTVQGFIKAVAEDNYAKAALYLRFDPALKKEQDREKLARSLRRLLDQKGNLFPYSLISNESTGYKDDNLGPNLDRVGTATVNNEQFDLILENTEDADGAPVWLFSSETIQRVPLLTDQAPAAPLISRVSPDFVKENKWGGVPIGHWLAMLILIIAAYLLSWSLTKLVLFLIPMFWVRARVEPTSGILKAFSLPIQLYLAIWLFVFASEQAGISIIVRQRFSNLTVIVGLIAILLLLWQLLDFSTRFFEKRLARYGNQAGVSAVLFLRRAAKAALIFLGVILILGTFGVNVTTGIAALGIGGIALALGAQKTVENFVGSVTLIADQPVRVGDFCKVGDTVGTIEQIGMRSTRIRTLDRTIVTIPNGDFASQKIENFAHRDRFWFHPTFKLRFETTPDQIRFLLVELRSILYAHPKVSPDPARIRFVEIGADSLNLEVFAYVTAIDFDQFLEVQEDLYLRLMDVIAASGTGFAFPSQTVYLAKDPGVSKEKAEEKSEQVRKWREAGDMHIPKFPVDTISHLKDTISYPPEGSSSAGNMPKHN